MNFNLIWGVKMGKIDNFFNLQKKLIKESKKAENYNTGLVGEQLIVASYKTMPLDKLEKMRFIINKIIKQKKEFIRVAKAQESDIKKGFKLPILIDDKKKE